MTSDFHKAPKAWAQVKHSILGNYLSLFLGKLGLCGKPVYYVDGFAGPGQLDDGSNGSPLIAAELAVAPRQKSRQGLLQCINVEEDPATFANLEKATAQYVKMKRVKNFQGSFQSRLLEILAEVGENTAFFFIDPFGTAGVDVDTLKTIASRPGKTEILVRYDDTRVKRLLSWAVKNEDSFDEGHRKTARAFKSRVDGLTDEGAAGIVGVPESEALIAGYIRKVKSASPLRFSLSYPIRNPETKGHRYFLVHFCDSPDGYIHMANFMAKVDRSVEGTSENDLFAKPQMEFMVVHEHIAGQKRHEMVSTVYDRIRSLWMERGWSKVQNRELYAGIVDEFGWKTLRSEYVEALRKLEKEGQVSMEGSEDNDFTVFTK
jgi:three-Cys-motif partner protein